MESSPWIHQQTHIRIGFFNLTDQRIKLRRQVHPRPGSAHHRPQPTLKRDLHQLKGSVDRQPNHGPHRQLTNQEQNPVHDRPVIRQPQTLSHLPQRLHDRLLLPPMRILQVRVRSTHWGFKSIRYNICNMKMSMRCVKPPEGRRRMSDWDSGWIRFRIRWDKYTDKKNTDKIPKNQSLKPSRSRTFHHAPSTTACKTTWTSTKPSTTSPGWTKPGKAAPTSTTTS